MPFATSRPSLLKPEVPRLSATVHCIRSLALGSSFTKVNRSRGALLYGNPNAGVRNSHHRLSAGAGTPRAVYQHSTGRLPAVLCQTFTISRPRSNPRRASLRSPHRAPNENSVNKFQAACSSRLWSIAGSQGASAQISTRGQSHAAFHAEARQGPDV